MSETSARPPERPAAPAQHDSKVGADTHVPFARPAAPAQHSPLIAALATRLSRRDQESMAILRRCLPSLPEIRDNRIWPLIVPYVGDNDAARDTGALTACLWAHYHTGFNGPVHGTAPLGAVLRRALPPDKHRDTYNALCFATWDTLPRVLAPLIMRCAGASQPLDWDQTQRDLRAWRNGDQDPVLRRWARSLFNPLTATIPAPTTEEMSAR